jgi:amino acid adenylation domain-containing protein
MGMLYHNNLNPAIYHNVHMRRIRGRLNEQELRQALEDVISQHPILRTSFDLSSYSEPLQLVHEKVDFPLEINRLRGNSQSEKEQELAELLSHEKNTPVDWSRAPLLRVRVDYLDDHTFHLMLAEHHAIFDGWSVASFCAEWFERYWSRVNGRSTEIKQGQNPFRDYVFRERQALQSLEDLEFWTEHVADTAPTRLSQRSFIDKEAKAGDVFRANIPPEISEGLKRAARLASVPIKSMLLAAHLRVLSFVSGQKEVITGVVTHGRPETANSDRALGLFLNALPVRKMLNGGTWTKLGRELFELERRIFPHRYYPSVELQQKLGRGELFETTFNFTYFHVYKEMEGISDWELQESRSTALTNLPLSANFTLEPGSGELRLDLAPAAGRFSITQVQTLLAFYERALTDIARNPEGTYESNLLSDDQSKQLLEEWQGQKIQFKQANHLARLFEDQVRRIPNAIALSCHDRVWTYAELNQKANRLARFLCRQGIAPEVIVGVAIERSAELVITLMAILKAGGAYLPLDLESPLPRLRYMLQNSEAKLVLSWKPMGFPPEISSSFQTVRFLNLSDHEGAFERESGDNFENGACTDNLAYVIYTSGSTGVPKGVMVRHAALINHMLWMAQCFNWNQQTRILLKTPITFDASVWEFLAPLVSGAVLVIGPPDAHQDFSVLVQTIRSQSITVLQMVPSALKFLLQEPHFGDCSSLKFVFCGGEEVAPSLLEQLWKQNLVEFGNLYGPTECTIDALYWTGSPGANVPQVPIGRPLPNIEAYVLNQDMELVPPGTSGEIYLGGAGLARGYFGRADLTAEKFVPNPLDSNGGARLYRTGDHGVWSLEGQLHFCGRTDQQVKIHGFRIEIGEIEEVLHRLEQVKEAAVVSRTVDGDPRLLSYVVLKSNVDNPGRAIERITAHLQQNLPRYMVPANTIIMNELPRLSNGKLDRKKLPLPDAETLQNQIDYVAPRTAVEARVAAIWADLLGGGRIGIHDDFFVRGGHSLLAIQAMSMLEKEFAVELSLNTLFEAPTVATLAQKIEELKRPPEPVYKAHYHIPELHAPTHN